MEPETNATSEVTKETKSGSLLLPGVIIALVVLAIPVIMSKSKKPEAGTTESAPTTTQAQPTTNGATISTAPVESTMAEPVNGVVIVEAGSFYYQPNLIKVKKGQKVKLVLNSVSMQHDFNIDELKIKIPVTKSGSSASVEFSVDRVGEYEFYCSVGEHRANGQVGKLIVTE